MLEFIVLGQIPGTEIVITFSWVITVASLLFGVSVLRHELKHRQLEQQVSIEELAI